VSQQHIRVVYDKAKYHDETVHSFRLPEAHSCYHTVYFLRWLIEHGLMSDDFQAGNGPRYADGTCNEAVMETYAWWDYCLVDDMLSEDGNAFAQFYFDFDKGQYIHDYTKLLKGNLPSEFHIPLTEENYQKLKAVIDQRYTDWKARRGTNFPSSARGTRRWWQFWRK